MSVYCRASTRLLTKKSCFDAGTASDGSTVKCNQYYSDDTDACKAESDAQAVGNSSSLAPLADDTQYDDSVSWASGLSCSKGPGAARSWLVPPSCRMNDMHEGPDHVCNVSCRLHVLFKHLPSHRDHHAAGKQRLPHNLGPNIVLTASAWHRIVDCSSDAQRHDAAETQSSAAAR